MLIFALYLNIIEKNQNDILLFQLNGLSLCINFTPKVCLLGSLLSESDQPETMLPYEQEHLLACLNEYTDLSSDGLTPDVVIVLSESFFDLTALEELKLQD